MFFDMACTTQTTQEWPEDGDEQLKAPIWLPNSSDMSLIKLPWTSLIHGGPWITLGSQWSRHGHDTSRVSLWCLTSLSPVWCEAGPPWSELFQQSPGLFLGFLRPLLSSSASAAGCVKALIALFSLSLHFLNWEAILPIPVCSTCSHVRMWGQQWRH